jgi:hypothetical protein
MKSIGVDLHKKTISLCGVVVVENKRKVPFRKRFHCHDTASIRAFFEQLGSFQVVVEATAAYESFLLLVEDLADRWVLAHPKKLRVIAESTRKTDKIDAQILAEFLALDMIPVRLWGWRGGCCACCSPCYETAGPTSWLAGAGDESSSLTHKGTHSRKAILKVR